MAVKTMSAHKFGSNFHVPKPRAGIQSPLFKLKSTCGAGGQSLASNFGSFVARNKVLLWLTMVLVALPPPGSVPREKAKEGKSNDARAGHIMLTRKKKKRNLDNWLEICFPP